MLVVVLTLYTALSAEFIIRFIMDKPMRRDREKGVILLRGTADKPIICMLIGLSTVLMLLFHSLHLSDDRTLRRLVRHSNFDPVALRFVCSATSICGQSTNDSQTDVFDGAMVASAMFTLNLFNPGLLLWGRWGLDKIGTDFGKVEDKSQRLS